jgi:hypothetical protein
MDVVIQRRIPKVMKNAKEAMKFRSRLLSAKCLRHRLVSWVLRAAMPVIPKPHITTVRSTKGAAMNK